MELVIRSLRWPALAALVVIAGIAGTGSRWTSAVQAQAMTTVQIMTGSVGQYLADANGNTLYVFSADQANSGASACNGPCATPWPPSITTGTPTGPDGLMGTLATITRQDGSMQVTYNGMPLYTFARDTSPGQTNGQGVTAFGGTWSVATP
jgi:predicted lipoprotein with Yx(FWY)xxD motif